jgi:hypothetical protein
MGSGTLKAGDSDDLETVLRVHWRSAASEKKSKPTNEQ